MSMMEKLQAGAKLAGAAMPDALIMAGAGLVSYGAWSVYPPAGHAVAGLCCLAGGWLLARGGH